MSPAAVPAAVAAEAGNVTLILLKVFKGGMFMPLWLACVIMLAAAGGAIRLYVRGQNMDLKRKRLIIVFLATLAGVILCYILLTYWFVGSI